MARITNKTTYQAGRSGSVKSWHISHDARQHMIGEAAYYRYVQRGYEPGHEIEDWLAAEADLERKNFGERASSSGRSNSIPQAASEAVQEEFGMQHGGSRSPAQDDALKRGIKGHPRRDIPRIESMEPEDAPSKE